MRVASERFVVVNDVGESAEFRKQRIHVVESVLRDSRYTFERHEVSRVERRRNVLDERDERIFHVESVRHNFRGQADNGTLYDHYVHHEVLRLVRVVEILEHGIE